jgi:glycosyltransferase involved in cell wall biosynthesis
MVLFLGRVRPYKGVLELIDAFRHLENSEVRLVIAGQPHVEDAADTIVRKIGDDSAIRFVPGFVPEEMIQVYMNACDVVALPYRDVLTSGAAVLAMSFGRACVAPRLGCLKDILSDDGAFLYDADEPDGLAGALRAAVVNRAGLPTMGAHNLQVARSWDWEGVARQTVDVYRRTRRGRRQEG